MLRPTPMKLVRLLVLTEDLPQASLTLAKAESFHADTRPPEETRLSNAPGRSYRELFQQARARLDKIGKLIPLPEDQGLEQVRVLSWRGRASGASATSLPGRSPPPHPTT